MIIEWAEIRNRDRQVKLRVTARKCGRFLSSAFSPSWLICTAEREGRAKKMWVAPTRQEKTANDSTQLDWRPIVSRTPNWNPKDAPYLHTRSYIICFGSTIFPFLSSAPSDAHYSTSPRTLHPPIDCVLKICCLWLISLDLCVTPVRMRNIFGLLVFCSTPTGGCVCPLPTISSQIQIYLDAFHKVGARQYIF